MCMSGTPEWLDDKKVNGFWGIQALTAPIIL